MAMRQIAYMDAGALLIARALIEGIAFADTLTHLAVGDGSFDVNQPIDRAQTRLVHEIGRARYLRRSYVVEDPDGPIVLGDRAYRDSVVTVDGVPTAVPTNLVHFVFRFATDDAQGNWTEYGLYGGGVRALARGAALRDANQGGDDRANRDLILGGSYSGGDSQTLTITVTVGGGSGVAHIGWASDGSAGTGSATVTFGVAIVLTGTGLTLTFSGGTDMVLTHGDQWKLQATRGPDSATFASGGIYDPIGNRQGQVLVEGDLFRLERVSPADVKGAAVIDTELVVPILADLP